MPGLPKLSTTWASMKTPSADTGYKHETLDNSVT
jgi:hypothetical protein